MFWLTEPSSGDTITSLIPTELRIIYGSIYYSYLVCYKKENEMKKIYVSFEVITVVTMKKAVFSHFSNHLFMHRLYSCILILDLKLV
jgi:hypothetical protein